MRKMIVKVQLPLMSNETDPRALIYNEDRSFETFYPTKGLSRITNGLPKAFLEVEVAETKDTVQIKFGKLLEDQGW